MAKRKNVSMDQIAKKANVATSTVSRVLKGFKNISEETRKHVLKVVEKENYRVNRLVYGVMTKQSFTFGFLFSTLRMNRAELYRGCYREVIDREYLPYLAVTDDIFEKEAQGIELYFKHQIDGLVICSHQTEFLKNWKSVIAVKFPKIPVVFIDILPSKVSLPFEYDFIKFDYEKDFEKAVAYLISLGHKKIAYLGGNAQLPSHIERCKGYMKGMKKAGLEKNICVIQNGLDVFSAKEEINQLLEKDKSCTAIISASDTNFQGHFFTLLEKGVTPNKDITMMYHTSYESNLKNLFPDIPRIQENSFELGRLAVSTLFDRLKKPGGKSSTIKVEGKLIV